MPGPEPHVNTAPRWEVPATRRVAILYIYEQWKVFPHLPPKSKVCFSSFNLQRLKIVLFKGLRSCTRIAQHPQSSWIIAMDTGCLLETHPTDPWKWRSRPVLKGGQSGGVGTPGHDVHSTKAFWCPEERRNRWEPEGCPELGGGRGSAAEVMGGAASCWSLCVAWKESMPEQVGKGHKLGKGSWQAGLVCSRSPQPSGALSSTPQHSASRGTACRRDGCSAGSSPGPWAPQTGGPCSPDTGSNSHGSFFPCTRFWRHPSRLGRWWDTHRCCTPGRTSYRSCPGSTPHSDCPGQSSRPRCTRRRSHTGGVEGLA